MRSYLISKVFESENMCRTLVKKREGEGEWEEEEREKRVNFKLGNIFTEHGADIFPRGLNSKIRAERAAAAKVDVRTNTRLGCADS